MAEILLYAASRAQNVNRLIKPALEAGQVVISERFVHSSLAYQGYGLGRDLKLIRDINALATGDIQPDLIFLLDSAPETSGKRVAKRSKLNGHDTDRIEMRGLSFQDRVRTGFLTLAQEDASIIVINTAGKSINAVFLEIAGIVSEKLNIELS
jgi:dTMP kinase